MSLDECSLVYSKLATDINLEDTFHAGVMAGGVWENII